MMENNVLKLEKMSAIPAEGINLFRLFHKLNIRSGIYFPLFYEKKLYGFLAIDTFQLEMHWEKDDIDLLRMLCDLFVHAIMRREQETNINQTTEHLIVLNKLFSINNNAENLGLLFETVIEIKYH